MNELDRPVMNARLGSAIIAAALLIVLATAPAAAQAKKKIIKAETAMVPMDQIGPQSHPVDVRLYARVIQVGPGEKHQSVSAALAAVADAAPTKRYAVLVAAGTYHEVRLAMKPHVDLYGGFAAGDWKTRDVHQHATVLDARKKGPVIIGADHARLDGFVVTGGEHSGHGGGVICEAVSPTIVNNIIVGNNTLKAKIGEGLGKQIGHEGGGIALTAGARAYIANNLIGANTTETGAGAGISARGRVQAKILRNAFCNNIAGVKDDQVYNKRVGSRSSPGGAIACAEESSPQISFNVIVLGAAPINNDAGGIWVEGNSVPAINYNWVVGNLSGDDGGGIYVMGNLYYDEAGKRHDSAPDGPVPIEDNVIAGNNTTRGGPGGVRVSRFGRVDLRRNVIVGNAKGGAHGAEGGVICVNEDNIIADNGLKKQPAHPSFRLAADVSARKFDERRYVTEIVTTASLAKEDFSGSVVRIGEQWSVVKSSGPNSLTIWGNITDKSGKLEVLAHYPLKK